MWGGWGECGAAGLGRGGARGLDAQGRTAHAPGVAVDRRARDIARLTGPQEKGWVGRRSGTRDRARTKYYDSPLALAAVLERPQADLAHPLVAVRRGRGLRAVRREELADRRLRRLEAEVAEEERRPRGLLLRAQDLLRRFRMARALRCRRGGRVAVRTGRCGGRGSAVEVVAWRNTLDVSREGASAARTVLDEQPPPV